MNAPFAILDDFLPDPVTIREAALKLPFADVKGPDGEVYKRVSTVVSSMFSDTLSKRLGVPITPGYSLFRLNYAGENPNNAIHSDAGYDKIAVVLYLNRPEDCRGGTAFWRHKKTGWDFLPTEKQVRSRGQNPTRVLKAITESWNNPEAWEQTHLAKMKFNRAICYPTTEFHSRFPFEAFGTTPENGRFIFCSFFTPA